MKVFAEDAENKRDLLLQRGQGDGSYQGQGRQGRPRVSQQFFVIVFNLIAGSCKNDYFASYFNRVVLRLQF